MKKQNVKSALIFALITTVFFFQQQILNVDAQTGSANPSPLQQVQSGLSPQDVKCNEGLVLIIKTEDGSPACVTQSTADALITRGWGKSLTDVTSSSIGTSQPSNLIITLQDNNNLIHLNKGDSFLLKLGDNFNWNVSIDNQTVVSRVPNVMVIRGAQGIYDAHNAGEAVLTAIGDPACRLTIPQCEIASVMFRLDIVVL
jgi:hypothetical protein